LSLSLVEGQETKPSGWFQALRRGHRMLQIRRDGTEDFACANCGAVYEMLETPAQDTGSAACEVCGAIMMKWVNAPIPLFRAKNSIEDARRRYFFPSPDLDQPTDRVRVKTQG
jgi:predicted nucleic acid-binding Zn ribbon protein